MTQWRILIDNEYRNDIQSIDIVSTIAGSQKFEILLSDVENINTIGHFADIEAWCPTTSPPGGLIFDGTDDFIDLANTLEMDSDNWAISWWMKRNAHNYETIFCETKTGASGMIEVDSTNNYIRIESSTNVPWLSGFSKRKEIVLTGGASGSLTNYQLKLAVSKEAAMQGDFDDLRFTQSDGETLIDEWAELIVTDTSATVWVEFPTTPANTIDQTYYMYYGNSGAASDWNFDDTFIFGDPFDNASLNTTRWPTVDANPTYSIDASNHYLEITDMGASNWENGKGFHSKTISLPTEWIIEDAYSGDGFGMYHHSTNNSDIFASVFSVHHGSFSDSDWGIGFYGITDFWVANKSIRKTAGVGGNDDYSSGTVSPSLPVTYDVKMWKTGGNIHITEDTVERVNEANSETPDRIHLGIGRYLTNAFGTKRFYAFKARKYAANPPTYAFGSEESTSELEMDTGIDTSDGVWHHYVLNFAAASTKLYVDNVLADTGTANPDTAAFDINYIGHAQEQTTPYGDFLKGSLADVRIFDGDIDTDEIARLNAGKYTTACKAFYTLHQSSAEDDAIYDRFEFSHGTSYTGAAVKGALTVDTSPLDQFIAFKGRVELIVPDYDTDTLELAGRDYIGELLSRAVVEAYGDPTPILRSAMVNDILLKYGTSMTRHGVDDSPSGTEIEYLFKTSAWDAIVKCAKDDGYKFFVDTDKDFNYHVKGWRESGDTLEVGIDDILKYKVVESGADIVNMVTVFGYDDGVDQIIVMGEDLTSQDYYGVINEKRIVDLNMMTEADAEDFAYKYLDTHSYVLEVIEIDLLGHETLTPGDLITLKIPSINIDGEYLIIDKQLKYPTEITTIRVAKYVKHLEGMISDMVEKILMLERYFMEEGSTVLKLHRVNEAVLYTDRITLEKRAADDSFKIGIANWSVIGTTKIGGRGGTWSPVHDSGW